MNAQDVIAGRAGLEGIRWALLDGRVRSEIRRAIGGLLEPRVELRVCRLRRAKFKPGRKLTLQFDAHIGSAKSAWDRAFVMVWGADPEAVGRDPAVPMLEAEARSRHVAAPFRDLFAPLPAWNGIIFVSPLDPRFPQLVRLSDAAHVATVLSSPEETFDSRSHYLVSTIRYRPGERHVVRYDRTNGRAPPDAVFAKLSRTNGREAFDVATHLAERIESWGGAPVRVARPLATGLGDQAALFQGISGHPLSLLLRRRRAAASRWLRAAGCVLRRLHEAPASVPVALERKGFDTEVEATRRASEHITALLPDTGALLAGILDRAGSAYARIPGEHETLTYGDLKADHVLVSNGGLGFLDFGTSGLADPALDSGKFLADLEWWGGVGRAPMAWKAAFLEGYGQARIPDRLLRSQLWEALFVIKHAAHRIPLFSPDWAVRTREHVMRASALLEAAERKLH